MDVRDLGNGFISAQVSHTCWAQWPKGREPVASDVFEPEWNAVRFLLAWEAHRDSLGKVTDGGKCVPSELDELKAENERLKAALQTIVEMGTRQFIGRDTARDAIDIATEALKEFEK